MKLNIITLPNGDKVSSLDIETKRILVLFKMLVCIITAVYIYTSKKWYIYFPVYLVNVYLVRRFLESFRKNRMGILEENTLYANFFFVFDTGFKLQVVLDYISILYGKKIPIECKILTEDSSCPAHLGMVKKENSTQYIPYIGIESSLLRNCLVEENAYVIVHEYTHFTHKDHTKLHTMFSWMIFFCPLNPILFLPISLIFYSYIEKRMEYAADHVAASVVDKQHAISVLTKTKANEEKQFTALNKKQRMILVLYSKLVGTHPPTEKRIKFIESL